MIHSISFRSAKIRIAALAVALLVFLGIAGYFFLYTDGTSSAEEAVMGEEILLVSNSAQEQPEVNTAIDNLVKAGFEKSTDADTTLQKLRNDNVAVFAVTQGAYNEVPSTMWADLYSRHVVILGLNVSLADLQPYVIGSAPGPIRHPTADRSIFSVMVEYPNCGFGFMSDWLDHWNNLAALLESRAAYVGSVPTLSDCPPFTLPGEEPGAKK